MGGGMADTLTTKQERFVLAYIGEARFNAAKAARMAGYAERSAHVEGHRLLRNADIAARVKDLLSTQSITAEAVLTELADIATADWRDFIKIKTDRKTGEEIEVNMDLGAKVKSLELLAKAHGLLTDRLDVSGTMTNAVQLVGVNPDDI
jgi:phage terminase small subunit